MSLGRFFTRPANWVRGTVIPARPRRTAAQHPAAASPARPRAARRRYPAAAFGIVVSAALGLTFLQGVLLTGAGQRASASTTSSASVGAMLQGINEVNYYPSASGWAYMWTNFDPAQVGADFARLHAMGANTVRIFIQPSVFGYPTVSAQMAGRLSTVIGLAAANGLRVHLTLFDWWSSFSDITGSEQWVSSLLSPYRNNPTIAIVELHNEIKPGSQAIVTWLAAMLPYVSQVLPGVPRTVSVACGLSDFALLTQELKNSPPDFWDYHYYGPAWDARYYFSQVKQIGAPLPVFIGETGYSTGGPVAAAKGDPAALDQAQAAYYQVIFSAAAAAGLPRPAPWTLNDFGPSAIPAGQTASDPSQYHYGLFRTNGTPKPAAAAVQAGFSGTAADSIDGGFEHESLSKGKTIAGSWQVQDPTQATFGISHSVFHSGTASAEIANSAGHYAAMYAVPAQAVLPGAKWTISGWARGTGTSGTARIAVQWLDGSGHFVGRLSSASLPAGSSGWTRLTATGTVPPGATGAAVVIETINDRGIAWFDDVTVSVQ